MASNTVVDWIEEIQVANGARALELSEPSKTWVDRMWHAMIDTKVGEREYDRLDRSFTAYLDRQDEEERLKAVGVLSFLAEGFAESDEWPRCKKCGAFLCPHCGRHGWQNGGGRHD